MGHKAGNEHWREAEQAGKDGLSQKEFSSATYYASGAEYQRNMPGIYFRNDLNPRLQVSGFYSNNGQVGQSFLDKSYNYGALHQNNGNVISIINNKDSSRTQSFAYDALNRITSGSSAAASGALSWGETYGIDPWGNLMISPMGGKAHGGNFQHAGSVSNQASGLGYDAAGNLTNYTAPGQYVYDPENRIQSTAGVTDTYDADGNRVEKSGGAVSTLYWYGAPGIIAESDLSGTLKSEYVFFNGKRLARIDLPAGTVHYYLSDHLNSTSMVVSAAGVVEDESDYSPFGTEYQITTGSNHYKFTGKERDTESGLDYFGARYYSTGLGRFTTPDEPFADEDEGDPQSWNLYMYTSNNPLRYVDPDGRSHVDKNGYIVGDYDGELIDNRSLVWDAKNQQWDRPQAPPPDNGAINPGFLGPFDIFFFGRLPGGSAARVAEEGAAKAAAEAAAKAAAEAAAKAAAEAALKKEIEGLVAKAASTVGNQGIQASSRAAAEQAAREWVGAGARDIVDRQTGKVVGQISADGTKVARFTSAGKSQPYINLVNKTTGGNLHVKF